ncbi:MAG: hypothetical protein QXH34_08095 [Ignisphaera sp.]
MLYHGDPVTNRSVFTVELSRKEIEVDINTLNKMLDEHGIRIVRVYGIDEVLDKFISITETGEKTCNTIQSCISSSRYPQLLNLYQYFHTVEKHYLEMT